MAYACIAQTPNEHAVPTQQVVLCMLHVYKLQLQTFPGIMLTCRAVYSLDVEADMLCHVLDV